MASPYSIPIVTVDFESTYQIIDKLGYHQTLLLGDAWADVLSDLKAAEEGSKNCGQGSVQTADQATTQAPPKTVADDERIQTLWLEDNTGALCLRPHALDDPYCCFTTDVTWLVGNPLASATGEDGWGEGSQVTIPNHPAIDCTQESQIKNWWYPLSGNEYYNVWREIRPDGKIGVDKMQSPSAALEIDTDVLARDKWEHFLASNFQLEKNASFCVTFREANPLKGFTKTVGTNQKEIPAFIRVYWGGKHAIQYDGSKLKYSYNAWSNSTDGKEFVEISGVSLSPTPTIYGNVIAIVVQIVNNAIVVCNLADLNPAHSKGQKKGWVYLHKDADSVKNGLTVLQDYMYVGVQGLPTAFQYVPVYYTPSGKLTSRVIKTGVQLVGMETSKGTLENGGEIDVTAAAVEDGTAMQYTATLARDETTINRTPQLFSITVVSDPIPATISISPPIIGNKVRSVTLNHGIFQQSGTIVVDNADGRLKQKVGVFPVTIRAAWARTNGQIEPSSYADQIRFKGFATSIEIDKKSAPYSTATIQLVGRSLQLQDAIAINLPIYDGEIHTDAVRDLLQRGGWYGETNFSPLGQPFFTDPNYRLSIPSKPGDQPLYMFNLGIPIWTCLEEISRPMGYWAFVNSRGVFNYVPPFQDNPKMTYTEVPDHFEYNEWHSLSEVKETGNIKSAVMVIGLDTSFERPSYLISVIRAAGDIGTGDPTVGTHNYVPWLRWIVVQDGKINEQGIVDKVAARIFHNNNRPRWTIRGRVWGSHVYPLDVISVNLKNDQIGIPQGTGGKWRVLTVNETLDGENKTWFMDVECEWVDPRYSYAAWWGRN